MTDLPIQIFKTGHGAHIERTDTVVVRIGKESVMLTAGEWSRLLANPQKIDPTLLTDGPTV